MLGPNHDSLRSCTFDIWAFPICIGDCIGLRGISVVFGHAVPFDVPVFEVRLHENPLISWLQVALEI